MTSAETTVTTKTTGPAPAVDGTSASGKMVWKFFWDLQCPYSKKSWEQYGRIRERFLDRFEFQVHITSLLFHRQAFAAQCAASLINTRKGPHAKRKFVDACFAHQDRYFDAAVGDSKPSDVDAIFAGIAREAGLFDEEKEAVGEQPGTGNSSLTEEYFLSHLRDWKEAVLPAWTEHKIALSHGVYGTAQFVIEDQLVQDTESGWTAHEWEQKLTSLSLLGI
jgi:hypothetical protein